MALPALVVTTEVERAPCAALTLGSAHRDFLATDSKFKLSGGSATVL